MDIGERIRLLLETQSMSQAALAGKIGISRQVLNNKINGLRTFSTRDIKSIASVLGVSSDYLLGRIDTFWPTPDMCMDPEGQGLLELAGV